MRAQRRTPGDPALRWDDFRVLLALARHGALGRAADALEVNISTVSRRLDALEAALGVQLFDRNSDGTRPTAAAEQLLPLAETMEHAADTMAMELQAYEADPQGEVRIAAPPGVVDHFLAPDLVDLHRAHPRLQITILSAISYADLTRREADLALRLTRPQSGELVATKLMARGYCIVAAECAAATMPRLADPDDASWVTWGPDLAHLPDHRWIRDHVTPSRVVLMTSSMTAQLAAVRTGLGLMIVPEPYAALPGLAAVPCSPKIRRSIATIPPGALWLVGHGALRDVPRIAAVWSWLKTRFT